MIRLRRPQDALSFRELLKIVGKLQATCEELKCGGPLTLERTLLGSVALALKWITVLSKAAMHVKHEHVHELFSADYAPRPVSVQDHDWDRACGAAARWTAMVGGR